MVVGDVKATAEASAMVKASSVQLSYGSCQQVFGIGGKLYTYTLPDAYYASL